MHTQYIYIYIYIYIYSAAKKGHITKSSPDDDSEVRCIFRSEEALSLNQDIQSVLYNTTKFYSLHVIVGGPNP